MTARVVRGRIPWNVFGAERKAYPPGSIKIPPGARMMLTDPTLKHLAGKVVSTRDTPAGLEVVAELRHGASLGGLGDAVLTDLAFGAPWYLGLRVEPRTDRLLAFVATRDQTWPDAQLRLDATGIPPAPRVDLSPLPADLGAWWATPAR